MVSSGTADITPTSPPYPSGTKITYICTSPSPANLVGDADVICQGTMFQGAPPECLSGLLKSFFNRIASLHEDKWLCFSLFLR